eukprot:CAMPEP_0119403198 /NCGR_PEP_ID=MMETSP1334-20130426/143265_1 /TAXON_ID=127549 /ORGANISM="Calcidiscus leptoporus, Strain RCC1130" /LENGTH=466 /DNA_ID=CAMNT_0007427143 /DNA_START=361 /DNA_END=1758 /DNA_ORIENTATION=+
MGSWRAPSSVTADSIHATGQRFSGKKGALPQKGSPFCSHLLGSRDLRRRGNKGKDIALAPNDVRLAHARALAVDDHCAQIADHPKVLREEVVPVVDVVVHPGDVHHVHVERRAAGLAQAVRVLPERAVPSFGRASARRHERKSGHAEEALGSGDGGVGAVGVESDGRADAAHRREVDREEAVEVSLRVEEGEAAERDASATRLAPHAARRIGRRIAHRVSGGVGGSGIARRRSSEEVCRLVQGVAEEAAAHRVPNYMRPLDARRDERREESDEVLVGLVCLSRAHCFAVLKESARRPAIHERLHVRREGSHRPQLAEVETAVLGRAIAPVHVDDRLAAGGARRHPSLHAQRHQPLAEPVARSRFPGCRGFLRRLIHIAACAVGGEPQAAGAARTVRLASRRARSLVSHERDSGSGAVGAAAERVVHIPRDPEPLLLDCDGDALEASKRIVVHVPDPSEAPAAVDAS